MRTYGRICSKIKEVEERKDHAFCGALALLCRSGMTLEELYGE